MPSLANNRRQPEPSINVSLIRHSSPLALHELKWMKIGQFIQGQFSVVITEGLPM